MSRSKLFHRWFVAFLVAGSLCLTGPWPGGAAQAQEASGIPGDELSAPELQFWSLSQCMDLALKNNPNTRAAYLSMKSASQEEKMARSELWPTVDFEAQLGTGGDLGNPGAGTTSLAGAGFSVRYLLLDWGGRSASIDAATARAQRADFGYRTVLLDVALSVEEAFFLLQGAQWYEGVVERIIQQSAKQLELATARYEVGLARKYDVVQAKAQLKETEVLRTTAVRQLRQARGELLRSMGMEPVSGITVEPFPEDLNPAEAYDVTSLIDEALRRRPELSQARLLVDEKLAGIRLARSERLPSVSASATVGSSYQERLGGTIPWTATVGLSFPIFSGGRYSQNVEWARLEEQKARAELAGQVTDIQFEVWSAVNQLQEDRAAMEASAEVVIAAEEGLMLAEENYKAGVGTIIEVFDAQATDANARLMLVDAKTQVLVSTARLERAIGRLWGQPESAPTAGEG